MGGGDAGRQAGPAADRTIIRTVKDRSHPYTIINNTVFDDARLSWKAKGLMGYLLSKPDDWRVCVADLVARGDDGVKAVHSGLRELVAAGYVDVRAGGARVRGRDAADGGPEGREFGTTPGQR